MKIYEILCAIGQNRETCPYYKQGAFCVNCSNVRYKPRESNKQKQEINSEEKLEVQEETINE